MASSTDQPESCVLDIGHWISANRLKLNTDKTERLFVSSGHYCAAMKSSYPVLKLDADTAVVGQITAGVERCCACYHRHSED